MIDIDPGDLNEIKRILREHVPDCEVRVFGSRISGRAKKYSDLDLALVDKEPIAISCLDALKESFALSDLPIRVDVLDWNRISENFRKTIEEHCELLSFSQ